MRKLQALGGAAALLAALLLGGCSQTAVPATPEQAATGGINIIIVNSNIRQG